MTASGTDAAGSGPANPAALLARQIQGMSKPRMRRLVDMDDGVLVPFERFREVVRLQNRSLRFKCLLLFNVCCVWCLVARHILMHTLRGACSDPAGAAPQELEFVVNKEAKKAKREWKAEQEEKGALPKPAQPKRASPYLTIIVVLCSTLSAVLFGYRMYLSHYGPIRKQYVRIILYDAYIFPTET
jgi:hypothetical protein